MVIAIVAASSFLVGAGIAMFLIWNILRKGWRDL
jgi:hypothetical protein